MPSMIVEHYVADVLKESTTLNELQSRTHGLDHWFRVWRTAQWLVRGNGTHEVDMEVVALFALFHDAMRISDFHDPEHGTRGWLLWSYLYDGSGHMLTESQKRMLAIACEDHGKGFIHWDPTIAICWDADRLDLPRMDIWPEPEFMSTGAGKLVAMKRVSMDKLIF